MQKRYVSIWFPAFKTDWMVRRQPQLSGKPFVLAAPDHGRLLVTAANALAKEQGVFTGQVLSDARAIASGLAYFDDEPGRAEKVLSSLGEWFIRFSPVVAIDAPGGLVLDASGCAHLWGGEENYIAEIRKKMLAFGYQLQLGMADTIGSAWAVARHSKAGIIKPGAQQVELSLLPVEALRLPPEITERLHQLGLRRIHQILHMQPSALRRRFGNIILTRLQQALGTAEEYLQPLQPPVAFEERLPCPEPIVTYQGIVAALEYLLAALCKRLTGEDKGLRKALFKAFRADGKTLQLQIGTLRASANATHLLGLFKEKIETLQPEPGIELFTLEAPVTEELQPLQTKFFEEQAGLQDTALAELLDRINSKFGEGHIHRYIPAAHHWPERSLRKASELHEQAAEDWRLHRPRPIQLLPQPAAIEVTAPVPDYPPMNFRYKGELHKISRADGPERIEAEWWIQDGQHRDYYTVEDDAGRRYWLFRLGHYNHEKNYQWFLHGFFS